MSDEQQKRFRFIHGILKGSVRNLINVTYGLIPKKYMTENRDQLQTPELKNLWDALEAAINEFETINAPTIKQTESYAMMIKIRNIAFTLAGSDTAYYILLEYFLKYYCNLKFSKAFGKEKVDEAFDEQWENVK